MSIRECIAEISKLGHLKIVTYEGIHLAARSTFLTSDAINQMFKRNLNEPKKTPVGNVIDFVETPRQTVQCCDASKLAVHRSSADSPNI